MREPVELHLDFDRNRQPRGERVVAEMLVSAAEGAGGLYVDFYAAPDEIKRLPPDCYIEGAEPERGQGGLGRLLGVQSVSVYVCMRVSTVEQLLQLWEAFGYSSPKLYRVTDAGLDPAETPLRDELAETFQWAPLDGMYHLLNDCLCVFRDLHDEVGIEALCRPAFEERLRYLARIYLGDEVIGR